MLGSEGLTVSSGWRSMLQRIGDSVFYLPVVEVGLLRGELFGIVDIGCSGQQKQEKSAQRFAYGTP